MTSRKQSRREFLSISGSLVGGSWLALHWSAIVATAGAACQARREAAGFEVLSASEASELEAIAGQIFPSDDSPGAREAGVIHFIDRALAGFMSGALDGIRAGLGELQARVESRASGVGAFSSLASEDQISVLREIERTPFFQTLRLLTVAGMFGQQSYGGNREGVGWKLLEFEDRHAFAPPFGYYDAQYATGDRDGE